METYRIKTKCENGHEFESNYATAQGQENAIDIAKKTAIPCPTCGKDVEVEVYDENDEKVYPVEKED